MKINAFTRRFIFNVISFINSIIPKSSKKIFFYDSTFRKDNLWALCRYLADNNYQQKYTITYFVSQGNVDAFSQNIPGVTVVKGNLTGLFHHMTSKYIFSGFGAYRFISNHTKKQINVNLWHGSPLKTVGLLNNKNMWYEYSKVFNYTLCASDYFKDIMKFAFEFKDEQAMIMGAPRNDYIFSKKDCIGLLDVNKDSYNKIILWMPTFRKSQKNNYIDSNIDFPILNDDNIKKVNTFLFENRMLLIIKPHPFQEELSFLKANHSNINIYNNYDLEEKGVELYELLGQVDALITDYSSVYFDFLLTQKPIGFVLDDLEEYKEKRGFVVEEPLKLMPGEKIYNEQDFLGFFDNLANNKDEYKVERKKINDLANKYQDDKNCKRIFDFLDITLES